MTPSAFPSFLWRALLALCLVCLGCCTGWLAPPLAQAQTTAPPDAPRPAEPGKPAPQQQEAPPLGPTTSPAENRTPLFRSQVNLVSVYATVTDNNGAPFSELRKEDFVVTEDGHAEKVAIFEKESERPLSIIVAMDASQSVRKDLKLELDSARRFIASILRPVDSISLYQFSEVVKELVPFTSDFQRLERGIRNVRIGAGTALYDALYLAGQSLSRRQGRKVMVVITDGGDTVSTTDFATAVRAAQEAESIVYSIIMVPIVADAGRNVAGEHALIEISRQTGGKYYYADTPQGLDDAFQRISRELRMQYLLAYYPSRRVAGGDFRRIDIKIASPAAPAGLTVHNRAGYFTSKLE